MISMSTVRGKDQATETGHTRPLLRETALWREWLESSDIFLEDQVVTLRILTD